MNSAGSKKKIYFIAIIAAISVLAVFGDKGLLDVWRFRKERQKLAVQKSQLEDENRKLAEEIRLLKTDKQYALSVARQELGMVKKDEVIYMIEKE
ncbi:MAG TPA: septum formation initiator family protein [Thermodesulfobacteriota bacterium]|nr:septum formation initiator family protein [Thermodesulfobacteriota bacterium]